MPAAGPGESEHGLYRFLVENVFRPDDVDALKQWYRPSGKGPRVTNKLRDYRYA
jgi:hypothetical protein